MAQNVVVNSYKNCSLHNLTCTGTEAAFPTPTATALGGISGQSPKPERIEVQAATTNTQPIVIGKTGVAFNQQGPFLAVLTAGTKAVLTINDYSVLYAISSGTQYLSVMYFAKVNG